MKWKKRVLLTGATICLLLFSITTVSLAAGEGPEKGVAQRLLIIEQFFEDLKTNFTRMKTEINSLKKTVEEQESEIIILKGSIVEQQGISTALKIQLDELRSRVDKLEKSEIPHSVSGTMVDSNGKPFFSGFALYGTNGSRFSISNVNNGTFAFNDIPDGTYNVRFYFGSYTIDSPKQITVAGADITGVTIKLTVPTYSISGQAIKSDGSLLGNHAVTLKDNSGNIGGYWPRTNSDGTFNLQGIAPGQYTLQVGEMLAPVATAFVTITDRDITGMTVQTVTGSVYLPNGQ
jgi:uncharacterized coiled-coil protein SlyX